MELVKKNKFRNFGMEHKPKNGSREFYPCSSMLMCSGRLAVQHNPKPTVKVCIDHVQECLPNDPLPPKQKPRLHSFTHAYECTDTLSAERREGKARPPILPLVPNHPTPLPSFPLPPSLQKKKLLNNCTAFKNLHHRNNRSWICGTGKFTISSRVRC